MTQALAVQIRYPIFERQDWESDEQWATFQHYRNTPSLVRSLDKTSHETYVRFRKVETYANEQHWKQRAIEYDRHLDHQAILGLSESKARALIRRERLETLQIFADVVKDELEAIRCQQAERKAKGATYSILKPSELVRFLKEPMLLERLLLGESTENLSVRGEAAALAELGEDELDQLETLATKVRKKSMVLTEGKEKG